MFEINFKIFIFNLLPVKLRTLFWLDFLEVCSNDIKVLHEELIAFRNLKLKEVNYTSQTVSLTGFLQSTFHPSIFITENENSLNTVELFSENHGQLNPVLFSEEHNELSPTLFSEKHFQGFQQYHYTVHIPSFTNSDQVRAAIDRVNLPSINYNIVSI